MLARIARGITWKRSLGTLEGAFLSANRNFGWLNVIMASIHETYARHMERRDGSSAWELLSSEAGVDVLLTDWMMPGLDGFETTRRIKTDKRFRHLPVIFMTGLTGAEHVVHAFEAGGVDYVRKPVVIEELLARVRVHLANARIIQGSQIALDTSGRPSFAIDASGAAIQSFLGGFKDIDPCGLGDVPPLFEGVSPKPKKTQDDGN